MVDWITWQQIEAIFNPQNIWNLIHKEEAEQTRTRRGDRTTLSRMARSMSKGTYARTDHSIMLPTHLWRSDSRRHHSPHQLPIGAIYEFLSNSQPQWILPSDCKPSHPVVKSPRWVQSPQHQQSKVPIELPAPKHWLVHYVLFALTGADLTYLGHVIPLIFNEDHNSLWKQIYGWCRGGNMAKIQIFYIQANHAE